ncbi:molybdopterin converting factor subunit 1 [Caldalkalibacillus salinus]|uniref:molybdopterin converting factor subunit 1 n=1 Tax=Caldalkalibacillus salinus TaxID=2803787 RepID=UPI0019208D0E|nr:molybdopterin converting factor subunit 1 [Caldalkalibacillus salinus]
MIKVLFFAGLAEKTGQRVVELDYCDLTVRDLKSKVIQQYPSIKQDLDGVMVAVNEEFVNADYKISSADEVAFIPPVSGG